MPATRPDLGRGPDLGRLFELHGEALCRTIHAMTGSRQLAEDVVQDVFVFAHQRQRELVDGPGMRSWLFQVAINRMRHDVRSSGRYRTTLDRYGTEPPSSVPMPDEEVRRRDNARRIQECVLRVPLAYREVFVLFELEAHSGQEIADALEIDVKTVWTRLHRARAAFREAWGRRGSDE